MFALFLAALMVPPIFTTLPLVKNDVNEILSANA